MRHKRIMMEMVGTSVGGGRTYIRHFLRTLPEVDKRNEWFVFVHPRVKEEERWDLPPRIKVLTSRFAVKSWLHRILWQQVYIPWFVLRHRIDVLFSAAHFGSLFAPCRRVVLLCNASCFGPIYLERLLNWSPVNDNLKMRLHRFLTLLNIRFNHVVLTPTKAMRDIVGSCYRIPRRKWSFVHYAYQHIAATKKPSISPATEGVLKEKCKGKKIVLFVSAWTVFKNVSVVLRAADLLSDTHPEIQFVLTMDFSKPPVHTMGLAPRVLSRMYAHQAAEIQKRKNISQSGHVSLSEVRLLYELSDVTIFPSVLESFGFPMLEALANGKPVIAADLPVNREVLGKQGVYFDPLNASDLADKILEVLKNKSVCIGKVNFHTWDVYIQKIINILPCRAWR